MLEAEEWAAYQNELIAHAESFVSRDGENLLVDWKQLADSRPREGTISQTRYNAVLNYLFDISVLIGKIRGAYWLCSRDLDGINLNPRVSMGYFYFTRERDAIAYRDAMYGENSNKDIDIMRLSKTGVQ